MCRPHRPQRPSPRGGDRRTVEALLGIRAEVDPRLREIDVGTWAGLTWAEVGATDPATLAAWSGGRDVRRGGGETFAELRSRVWAVIGELAAAGGTVPQGGSRRADRDAQGGRRG
ncbi:MAG: histidine phosphatase family protein [Actinomycetota bacterium]|nr:histidine phosphatase family protein [Actinomycetota bacterium]